MTGTGSSGLPTPPLADRLKQKIGESKFFLEHMSRMEHVHTNSVNRDLEQFRYYTSAFLNAVRSPLQYIHKQVKDDPVKRAWYDKAINDRPILGFMADERNMNIHTMQTTPIGHVLITVDEGINSGTTGTTTFHMQWPTYAGADKTVTGMAADAIAKVQEIVDEGFRLGHLA